VSHKQEGKGESSWGRGGGEGASREVRPRGLPGRLVKKYGPSIGVQERGKLDDCGLVHRKNERKIAESRILSRVGMVVHGSLGRKDWLGNVVELREQPHTKKEGALRLDVQPKRGQISPAREGGTATSPDEPRKLGA